MSVSAETYIVISLMFAVFAAVAAVGTSVVLGAGFERLRAGFEVVRNQSGFFADAIYKLDQRTQKLDEAHATLKGNVNHLGERVERVEKTATFLADGINSLEQRILQGSPSQPQPAMRSPVSMNTVHTVSRAQPSQPKVQSKGWVGRPPVREQRVIVEELRPQVELSDMTTGLYRDFPEEAPVSSDRQDYAQDIGEPAEGSGGITTLLARYFTGEGSGSSKGVIYH
jgi:hypothetical protein